MRNIRLGMLVIAATVLLAACGANTAAEPSASETPVMDEAPDDKTDQEGAAAAVWTFRDVFGKAYEMTIDPRVERNRYDNSLFRHEGYRLYYDEDGRDGRLGIDVSHHQGAIDWQRVRADGYDFAFLRIGYRGYGEEGTICKDRAFDTNIREAQDAGLLVGAYFFAQAVNEEEAREEAASVIEWLSGYSLDLPVVYDPESILDDDARTDDVTPAQFTANTRQFCDTVTAAGYEAMIYCNMLWEAYQLDLATLSDYTVWYADYEAVPQTPYDFSFWQYTNEGIVDGVDGPVDLDIWMR